MTEYWKSQGRKFCDFCKCWIADNRPSIEFHERGKKHQENVNKRLKEIHKNTAKQVKDQKKFDNEFKKMEKAALAAYLKDVEGGAMVDMTAQQLLQEKSNIEKSLAAEIDPCDPSPHFSAPYSDPRQPSGGKGKPGKGKGKSKKGQQQNNEKREHVKKERKGSSIQKVWYEARTPEGYTYYWNTQTNESVWEPPAEGFMSIEEQEKEAESIQIQEQFLEQIEKEEEKKSAEPNEEQRANAEREKMKAIRDKIKKEKNEEEEEERPYIRDYSVPAKPQPYGAWKPVVEVKQESLDYQLPERKQLAYVPTIQPEIQMKTFKEKKVSQISTGDSDDESVPSTFKKRKLGNRNVRKKTSDD